MRRLVLRTIRALFLALILGIILLTWGVGARAIWYPLDLLHGRFPWFPSADSDLGILLAMGGCCLLLAVLFFVFNFAVLVSAPKETRGKITWTRILCLDRLRAHRAAAPKPVPPVRHPESSNPLRDLPPWLAQGTKVGKLFLTSAILVLLVFLATFISFLIYWSASPSMFDSSNTVAQLVLILVLVPVWGGTVRKLAVRIQAFVVGPAIGLKRLQRVTVTTTLLSVVLLFAGLYQFRYWSSNEIVKIVRIYFATWAIIVGIVEFRWNIPDVVNGCKQLLSKSKIMPLNWSVANSQVGEEAERFVLCHLTDLHITGPQNKGKSSPANNPDRKTISRERAAGANPHNDSGQIWSTLRNLLTTHARDLEACHAILISGDLTDTGAASEWKGFFDAFINMESLLSKVVILPGNHDLNACRVFSSDDLDQRQRQINQIRFLSAVDRIQGERTEVFQEGKALNFRAWGRQFTDSFRSYVTSPPHRTFQAQTVSDGTDVTTVWEDVTRPEVRALLRLPEEAWEEAFPMLVHVGVNRRVQFLVFDSNMPGTNVTNNAFGELSKRQLCAAQRVIESIKTPIIIGLHHHLGNPPDRLPGIWTRFLDRALTLGNPEALLRILPNERSYIVFNGHRHLRYAGVIDNRVTVISGPSTTLGNAATTSPKERKPQIGRYELSWDKDGNFTHFQERWLPMDEI
jgi:3',5'-cyclic AMP phosphodiesterase CpdA